MSIKIFLHPYMYYLTESRETFETDGGTVRDCLGRLIEKYPELHDLIYYKDDSLQTFIEIYINRKTAVPHELDLVVHNGDEIHLMMTVAGG
jgi:molybdopterin converting factor small subunit